MNYQDDYELFMQFVDSGKYLIMDLELREWETVQTMRTLQATSKTYDCLYSPETEYLYQIEIRYVEQSKDEYKREVRERIEFDNQEQAEKVYEELLKRRVTK